MMNERVRQLHLLQVSKIYLICLFSRNLNFEDCQPNYAIALRLRGILPPSCSRTAIYIYVLKVYYMHKYGNICVGFFDFIGGINLPSEIYRSVRNVLRNHDSEMQQIQRKLKNSDSQVYLFIVEATLI